MFLTAEIGTLYGTDTTNLENWQALCREFDIGFEPKSIAECRRVRGYTTLRLVLPQF